VASAQDKLLDHSLGGMLIVHRVKVQWRVIIINIIIIIII